MKNTLFNKIRNCMLILLILTVSGAYGKKQELGSQWSDREITIDGKDNEWKAPAITKDKISLRAYNDDMNMVLCFTTNDSTVRARILGMGMTVWLNPNGGNEKKLGVHFPLAMKDKGKEPGPHDEKGRGKSSESTGDMERGRGPGPDNDGDMEDRDRFEEKMIAALDSLELIVPGQKQAAKMSLKDAAASGINAKMLCSKGKLIYELRIPLCSVKTFPAGVKSSELDSGKTIAIGIDIPGFSFPKRSTETKNSGKSGMSFEVGSGGPGGGGMGPGGGGMGGSGGGMGGSGGGMGGPGGGMGGPGGGMGGPGGGMGGPGGGMGGPGGGDFEQNAAAMKKSLNFWIDVKLAHPLK